MRRGGRESATIDYRFPRSTQLSPGALRLLSRISENSITSAGERQLASQKYREALQRARYRELDLRNTFPSFSVQQREKLSEGGFIVFRLYGMTLQQILERVEIQPTINPNIDTAKIVSQQAEVAFQRYATLRGCDEKTHEQQMEALAQYGEAFAGEFPGTRVIAGNIAEYAELELQHKMKYFGDGFLPNQYGGIRTTTELGSDSTAVIRGVWLKKGIEIISEPKNSTAEFIDIKPLILPTSSAWDGPDYKI